jgi:hypothetical protein
MQFQVFCGRPVYAAPMSPKAILFTLGCVLAWFVLMPAVVIGGGLALLLYAILAELAAFITGKPSKTLDTAAAREIARRMCGGNGVASRSPRHLSSQR